MSKFFYGFMAGNAFMLYVMVEHGDTLSSSLNKLSDRLDAKSEALKTKPSESADTE